MKYRGTFIQRPFHSTSAPTNLAGKVEIPHCQEIIDIDLELKMIKVILVMSERGMNPQQKEGPQKEKQHIKAFQTHSLVSSRVLERRSHITKRSIGYLCTGRKHNPQHHAPRIMYMMFKVSQSPSSVQTVHYYIP